MSPAPISGEPRPRFYVAGGTLRTDAACYVVRHADARLFQALSQGQFAYVLTSRQMGKSSLMVRTALGLKEEGFVVAIVDLSAIGLNLSADQWYYGLAEQIGEQCGFHESRIEEIWNRSPQDPPLRRWTTFVEALLRDGPRASLVVFIDEIDSVRSLSFPTDEFFASIRSFYNCRATQASYRSLTFCLLGVAAPAELIRNPITTPFNVGVRIELNDFSETEAAPLAAGMGRGKTGQQRLRRVLHWTGGHPYLTQRLCQAVVNGGSAACVDGICSAVFFGARARVVDENLAFVREYLLHNETDTAALLQLYRSVRWGRRVIDSDTNRLITGLRLSGICCAREGRLRVRNRIYARVFNGHWIRMSAPDAERRRQRAAFRRGFALASVLAAIILSVITFLADDVIRERSQNQWQLYIANIGLAAQAWEDHDLVRSIELLQSTIPRRGERDFRGFEWYALWNRTHAEHPLLSIHGNGLRAPVLSQDGRRIFAVLPDAVIELDSHTGHVTRTVLTVPHNSYPTLAISPDGTKLAVRGTTKFRLVDLVNNGPAKEATSEASEPVVPTEFLARSDPAPRGCADAAFLPAPVWKVVLTRTRSDLIRCVNPSPDQRYVALTTRNAIEVWSAAPLRRIASFPANQPGSVAFSGDSRYLAWGEYGAIHILGMQTKSVTDLSGLPGLGDGVAISPDGKWLASAGQDDVRLWDLRSRLEVHSFGRYAGSPAVSFFPDGGRLLVSGKQGIDIWDLEQRHRDMAGKDEIYTLTFSPDGRVIASGGNAGQLLLWNAHSQELTRVFPTGERIEHLAYLAARSLVVNTVHRVEIWDLAAGQAESVLVDSPSRVFAAVSPDRKTIAIANSATREMKLVDTATNHVRSRRLLDGVPGALAFAPDNRTLAVSLADERVEVLAISGTCLLKGAEFARAMAFSLNSQLLAVGYDSGEIGIWDWRRQRTIMLVQGHTAPIKSIEFSPDGTRLVSASDDGSVQVFDAVTYQRIVVFRESERSMETVAFSPDSRFLASSGDDHGIRLWDGAKDNRGFTTP